MPYSSFQIDGHTVVVPDAIAGHDETKAGLQVLLNAAWLHYNRALSAHLDGRPPVALHSIARALRLAPYSERIVECAITLAIQHGAFEEATARLNWAHETGMSNQWPDYRAALRAAVNRWNQFLDDTSALRAHYQTPNPSVSYRELLLLADRIDAEATPPLTQEEQTHLRTHDIPFRTPSATPSDSGEPTTITSLDWLQQQPVIAVGVAGLIGLFVGIGGMWAGNDVDRGAFSTPEVSTTSSPSNLPPSNAKRTDDIDRNLAVDLVRANLHVLQERPLKAYAILDSVQASHNAPDHDEADDALLYLRGLVHRALYDAGLRAWNREDIITALRMLEPIASSDVGNPQERLYVLGMAAALEGQNALAVQSLTRLQDHLTADYPHYDAQAAYMLVQLLPDTEARPYAQRIADRYTDTIYNNSVVQSHL